MKRLITVLFICVSVWVQASVRYTLEREASPSPLVYYFSEPDSARVYPILVICDGSESPEDIGSICFVRDYFMDKVRALNVGYLTVEKWGVDGDEVDETEFWNHYTRSQRLEDHLTVIRHFEKHPPMGWNGKFVFVGISEGGPLVTDLSILCPNTLATINWVGAGDWNWADTFWQFFEHGKRHAFWKWPSDVPETRQEFEALIPQAIANPTAELWMGGMTYLYHADAFQKLPIDYSKIRAPFLVVQGTEGSTIESCDQFVRRAQEAGAPVTYFRIDGMDHYIRKRPDVIDQSFDWLRECLQRQGGMT